MPGEEQGLLDYSEQRWEDVWKLSHRQRDFENDWLLYSSGRPTEPSGRRVSVERDVHIRVFDVVPLSIPEESIRSKRISRWLDTYDRSDLIEKLFVLFQFVQFIFATHEFTLQRGDLSVQTFDFRDFLELLPSFFVSSRSKQ